MEAIRSAWWVVVTAGLVALVVTVAWLALDYAYPGEALTEGKRIIQEQCEGHATFYDVEGQNLLVYACADGKLRTLDYGSLDVGRL